LTLSSSAWYLLLVSPTPPGLRSPFQIVRRARGQGQESASARPVLVSQCHFVTDGQRAKWENYSVSNDYWVDESNEVQKNDETYEGKIVTDYWTRGDIHFDADPYTRPGPYLPQ
jgi:hypothetical protein